MLRRVITTVARSNNGGAIHQQWRNFSQKSTTISSAVNTIILRSLKDYYVEVSNLSPPPKVSPPAEFTIVNGALDSNGPVLKPQF